MYEHDRPRDRGDFGLLKCCESARAQSTHESLRLVRDRRCGYAVGGGGYAVRGWLRGGYALAYLIDYATILFTSSSQIFTDYTTIPQSSKVG